MYWSISSELSSTLHPLSCDSREVSTLVSSSTAGAHISCCAQANFSYSLTSCCCCNYHKSEYSNTTGVISCHALLSHCMLCPVVSCNKINCVTSFCVLMLWQPMICHVISCHVTCHIMSYYNFMPCLVQSRHFVSFYVTSCHWSCHVML